jgi:hypothetical protein
MVTKTREFFLGYGVCKPFSISKAKDRDIDTTAPVDLSSGREDGHDEIFCRFLGVRLRAHRGSRQSGRRMR